MRISWTVAMLYCVFSLVESNLYVLKAYDLRLGLQIIYGSTLNTRTMVAN